MIAPTSCFLPGELVRCNTGNQRELKQNPQSPWVEKRVENSGRQSHLEFTWEGESGTGKQLRDCHLSSTGYLSRHGCEETTGGQGKNACKGTHTGQYFMFL